MFGIKKKEKEMIIQVEGKETYGEMEYTGEEIYDLIAEYVDVFKEYKKHYEWGVAVKLPNGFGLTVYHTPGYYCIVGKYNDVTLKDYQLSLLVDKLVPKMMQEIATERVRVTKLIEEL